MKIANFPTARLNLKQESPIPATAKKSTHKYSSSRLTTVVSLVGLAAIFAVSAAIVVTVVITFEASWIIAAVAAPLLVLIALIFLLAAGCLMFSRKTAHAGIQYKPHHMHVEVHTRKHKTKLQTGFK